MLHGLNFTLTTDVGDFDLLGEVVGGGGYRDLLSETLEALLRLKRAAGRPKDLEAIAELELIRDR